MGRQVALKQHKEKIKIKVYYLVLLQTSIQNFIKHNLNITSLATIQKQKIYIKIQTNANSCTRNPLCRHRNTIEINNMVKVSYLYIRRIKKVIITCQSSHIRKLAQGKKKKVEVYFIVLNALKESRRLSFKRIQSYITSTQLQEQVQEYGYYPSSHREERATVGTYKFIYAFSSHAFVKIIQKPN